MISAASRDHLLDPVGAVSILFDVVGRFFGPKSPGITSMTTLVIRYAEWDLAFSQLLTERL
jgi:hypothetical protein